MTTSRIPPLNTANPSTDQVARVVNRYYEVHDNELYMSGISVSRLVREFGSPLFVYDAQVIAQKVNEVLAILPQRFKLYYSIKANPGIAILKSFLELGCGLEVASAGEIFLATTAGCPSNRIVFAGPGKTTRELLVAIKTQVNEIHIESIEEARTIDQLANSQGCVVSVALRINPTDCSGGAMRMGGKASPFGIDEEELETVLDELVMLKNLDIQGVHLFMGTQILDSSILITQYRRALLIANRVACRLSRPLKTIDFGGGWGTPYFSHEQPLDLEALAKGLKSIDEEMAANPWLNKAEAILEPGRFLVNESGVYLASITRIKRSRGKSFAIIDGGMHHHLAASGNLGQTIKRNYPLAIVNKLGVENTEILEVVGPLCTPLDTIGRGLKLPPVQPGDLVGVFQSGAYARTSSPLGFLSHDSPAEVMIAEGQARLIRRRGIPDDYLRDQINLD